MGTCWMGFSVQHSFWRKRAVVKIPPYLYFIAATRSRGGLERNEDQGIDRWQKWQR